MKVRGNINGSRTGPWISMKKKAPYVRRRWILCKQWGIQTFCKWASGSHYWSTIKLNCGVIPPIISCRLNSGCLFSLLFLVGFLSVLNSGQKMRGFLISILINQMKNSLSPRDSWYQIQDSALLPLSDCCISAQIVFVPLYSTQNHRQQIKPNPLPHWLLGKESIFKVWFFWPKHVLCTPQHMRTRMYEESDLNLQRKDLLAVPWGYTHPIAGILPAPSHQLNRVIQRCKTLVLLQGCSVLRPPRERILVDRLGFYRARCSLGRWRAPSRSMVTLAHVCQAAVTCGGTPAASWPHTTDHPSSQEACLRRGTAHSQNTHEWEKHAPKVSHSPISSSMWSWRRYCSFPNCGVVVCRKRGGHWRASTVLGKAAAPSGGGRRRTCWGARQLSAALAAVSSIPRQGW